MGRLSVSTGPDVSYKEMAGHCEALLLGKQQKMLNFGDFPMQPNEVNMDSYNHSDDFKVEVLSSLSSPFPNKIVRTLFSPNHIMFDVTMNMNV